MADLGVLGLVISVFLLLVPSFILLNVGFRCYIAMLNSRPETQCKLDKDFALAVVVCGSVFLIVGILLSIFTVVIYISSRHGSSHDQVLDYI